MKFTGSHVSTNEFTRIVGGYNDNVKHIFISIEIHSNLLSEILPQYPNTSNSLIGVAACLGYITNLQSNGNYVIQNISLINWNNAFVMAKQLISTGQTWVEQIRLSLPTTIPNQISLSGGGGGIVRQNPYPTALPINHQWLA